MRYHLVRRHIERSARGIFRLVHFPPSSDQSQATTRSSWSLACSGQAFGDRALLKGGVVLELRLDRARATRDIDLRMVGDPSQLLEQLQLAGRLDLGDHLSFLVTKDAAKSEGDGVVHEGQRFRAEARLGGTIYGAPFGVDVAFGDPLVGEIEEHSSRAYLDFVGLPATHLRLYPRETHLAVVRARGPTAFGASSQPGAPWSTGWEASILLHASPGLSPSGPRNSCVARNGVFDGRDINQWEGEPTRAR